MGGALVLAEAPVHFLFSALTSVTIPLLQAPYQLVTFSLNAIEVVVSEIAPPLLDLPTHLLPLPFHHIGIHLLFLLIYNQRRRCRGLPRGPRPHGTWNPVQGSAPDKRQDTCQTFQMRSPAISLR